MPKSATFARDVVAFALMGRLPAWLASDVRYISLHTADPSQGNQGTSETTYSGYRRQEIDITSWTQQADGVYNSDEVVFPVSSGNSGERVITHLGIGLDAIGDGQLLYTAQLRKPVTLRLNDRLKFAVGEIFVTES